MQTRKHEPCRGEGQGAFSPGKILNLSPLKWMEMHLKLTSVVQITNFQCVKSNESPFL